MQILFKYKHLRNSTIALSLGSFFVNLSHETTE